MTNNLLIHNENLLKKKTTHNFHLIILISFVFCWDHLIPISKTSIYLILLYTYCIILFITQYAVYNIKRIPI